MSWITLNYLTIQKVQKCDQNYNYLFFSPKTAQTILTKLAQNVVLIDFETLEKMHVKIIFRFRDTHLQS